MDFPGCKGWDRKYIYIYNHPIGKKCLCLGVTSNATPHLSPEPTKFDIKTTIFAQRSHGRLQIIFDGRKNGKRRSHVFTRGCGIFSNRFLSTWSRCGWKSLGTSSKLCTWIIDIFAILRALEVVGLRSGRIDVPSISVFWTKIWVGYFGVLDLPHGFLQPVIRWIFPGRFFEKTKGLSFQVKKNRRSGFEDLKAEFKEALATTELIGLSYVDDYTWLCYILSMRGWDFLSPMFLRHISILRSFPEFRRVKCSHLLNKKPVNIPRPGGHPRDLENWWMGSRGVTNTSSSKLIRRSRWPKNPETEVLEEITEIIVSGQRTGRPSALGQTGRFWRTGIDVDYLRNLGEGGSQLLGFVVFDPVLTNKKKPKRSKNIKNWVVVEGSKHQPLKDWMLCQPLLKCFCVLADKELLLYEKTPTKRHGFSKVPKPNRDMRHQKTTKTGEGGWWWRFKKTPWVSYETPMKLGKLPAAMKFFKFFQWQKSLLWYTNKFSFKLLQKPTVYFTELLFQKKRNKGNGKTTWNW